MLTVSDNHIVLGGGGVGVPSGGAAGQVLAKASATDYDTEWVDQSGGGSSTRLTAFVPEESTTGTTIVQVPDFAMELPSGTWCIDACLILNTTSTTAAPRGGLNLLSGSVESCTLMITIPNSAVATVGKGVNTGAFISGGLDAISHNTGSGGVAGNVMTETGVLITTTGCTIGVQISNELESFTTSVLAGSYIIAEKLA